MSVLNNTIQTSYNLNLSIVNPVDNEPDKSRSATFEKLIEKYAEEDSPEAVLKIVKYYQSSKSLLEAAEKEQKKNGQSPNLTLSFTSQLDTDSSFDPSTGKVSLLKKLAIKEKIVTLLFELAKLSYAPDFKAATESVLTGNITTDIEYARVIQAIEYKIFKLVSETIQDGIKSSGWDPTMDSYATRLNQEWSSFEGYANHRNAINFDFYTSEFNELKEAALDREDFENFIKECAQEGSPEAILDLITHYPHSNELFEKAKSIQMKNRTAPTITLSFKPNLPFKALSIFETGEIHILESLTFKEKVNAVLFELANIYHSPEFTANENRIYSGEITDSETFARAEEQVEYTTCQLVEETVRKCVEFHSWDPAMNYYSDSFKNEWKTFESYYALQKESKHTDVYIANFEHFQKNALKTKANETSTSQEPTST